jgi:hypothetical protein
MKPAYDLLTSFGYMVTRGAVIISPLAKSLVDFYYKILPRPFILEWELVDHKGLDYTKVAVDMDGVLCHDCPEWLNDSSVAYIKWLKAVAPLFLPTYTIYAIVSCRLEKYREITVEWLKRNEVKYENLYLWDKPSYRDTWDYESYEKHPEFKAGILKEIKPDIYYESSAYEAAIIQKAVKIPVLIWQEKRLIQ